MSKKENKKIENKVNKKIDEKIVEQIEEELNEVVEEEKKEDILNIEEILKENEELKKDLEKIKIENDKLKNYAFDLKSDFETFKELVEKEKKDIKLKEKEKLIRSFLVPYEKLLISLNYKEDEQFPKAIEMVEKDMNKSFENAGLEFIKPSSGDIFDPFEHEVSDKYETDEIKEYHVYKTENPGYKLNGRVIEPARVVVAIKPKVVISVKEEAEEDNPKKEEGEN